MTRSAGRGHRPQDRSPAEESPTSQSNGKTGSPPESPTHLIIGRVLAPWGKRGQFRAEILTDFPERFALLQEVWVGEELHPYVLESARLYKGGVVLKLKGVDSPEGAAPLRGQYLYVALSQAVPLAANQYYHHQIIGLDAYAGDGRLLGRIVEILETGSNDVYVARKDHQELLIPALTTVVRQVDLEHHRLIVDLPPGLLTQEEA